MGAGGGGSADTEPWPGPAELMQRVADQAVVGIPGAEGASIGLCTPHDSVRYVCTSGYLASALDVEVPVDHGLYGVALRTGRVLSCPDTALDDRADPAMCRRFGVRSVLCVPLFHGRRAVGVLNVCASRVGAFTDEDSAMLQRLAAFVSTVVGAASALDQVTADLFDPTMADDADGHTREDLFASGVLSPFVVQQLDSRRRIARMLRCGEPSLVFQPIFDVATGRVAGYEALARFSETPPTTPDRWFAEAHDVGLGLGLELAAVKKALASLDRLPRGLALGINVGPAVITAPELQQLLSDADCRRVVLELTEHIAVPDYDQLLASVDAIRRTGARLAIDDTGAGVSNLAHILKLNPDFIKLDRSLVEHVNQDPIRHALIRALAMFAEDSATLLVAEGVESQPELAALQAIGVPLAQGFHLGHPQPQLPPQP